MSVNLTKPVNLRKRNTRRVNLHKPTDPKVDLRKN